MRKHYTPNEASYGIGRRIGKPCRRQLRTARLSVPVIEDQDGRSMSPSSNARSTVSTLEWVPSLR
ncbi:hypothetical protein ATL42_1900 [Sanguibacter antarcticus]|uniref:Uncharacterized protein n=1 Tax=Sanguibacter antarcticus TaxID=372484 RepID=A0A2A9E620_9MICO|nr:hypothetical protein ATL42_1900 [Sanguibacter antarcticus]